MVDDRALRLRQRGRQPRPTPSFVQPEPNALDFLVGNYLRAAPQVAKSAAETNIFNPVPSITKAANEGRLPTRGEVGTDAAFAAIVPLSGVAGKLVGSGIRAAAPYLRRAAYASDSPAVRETLGLRHFGPANLSVVHPRDVPIIDARTAGPGTYFATPSSANSLRLRLPGDRSGEYSIPLSFMDRYKLAGSRGYAGPEDVAKAVDDLGIADDLPFNRSRQPLNEATFDDSVVQDLLRKGFIGFDAGKNSFPTGEVTNWLVGAKDIRRINPRLPQLGLRSGSADLNSISRIESILRRLVPPQ